MPGIGDWIGEPLCIVDNFLSQSSPTEYKEKVSAFFTKRVGESDDSKRWIPSFNSTLSHDLKPNSLVRLRCMVQDMFGPEYYYDVFEGENKTTGEKQLHSGRYRDVTESTNVLHDSAATKTSERHVFYCVPVPAECSWVKENHKASCLSPRAAGPSKAASNVKRSREDDNSMEVEVGAAANDEYSKRSRSGDGQQKTNGSSHPPVSTQPSMNFPLPGETGVATLVKMYDGIADTIKLNDIIEVYGVISTDPSLAHSSSDDCEMFSEEEQKAHNPPSSLVPRLHAVHVNKLHSCNPLIESPSTNQKEKIRSESKEIRENILSILEHALCGDTLAAEYLLCHLLSSVYVRKDQLAVGKLSLNLTKLPAGDNSLVAFLVELLQNLVTNLYYLPISLDNMNKLNFIPTKDYDANRLTSGILQLPDRVHLVLNEMAMQPGQLDVNGVRNLTALGNLIRWQTVSYDFKFHQQDFQTDVPVLTLSEGKSLLMSDITVPLELKTQLKVEERQEAIRVFLGPALLDKIRIYLTLIPTIDYELNEQMTKEVQDDFVGSRQASSDAMSAEDFQNLLVLSRLLAISYGESCLTSELWSKAKHMEDQRTERLAS